jgi:hypothetical protein
MKREILLLLLRCLSTEPELCPAAVEATARDPEARRYAESLIRGTAALALPAPDARVRAAASPSSEAGSSGSSSAPLPASAAPMSRSSRR